MRLGLGLLLGFEVGIQAIALGPRCACVCGLLGSQPSALQGRRACQVLEERLAVASSIAAVSIRQISRVCKCVFKAARAVHQCQADFFSGRQVMLDNVVV